MESTKKDINQLRDAKFHEAVEILQKDKRCALICPTGFGKTGILVRVIKECNYKNVLYLYPSKTVRQAALRFYYECEDPSKEEIPGVTFMTYMKLIGLSVDEINDLRSNYDLIICDECHKMGASRTRDALDILLKDKSVSCLGATATPERMDCIDEIGRYFNTSVTKAYTLHNAFQDGILTRPYYVYNNYAREISDAEKEHLRAVKDIELIDDKDSKLRLLHDLDAADIQLANIKRMDHVIKDTCDKYVRDTTYMQFIVFCADFISLHQCEKKASKWFKDAYPDHTIKSLVVTSESEETANNVDKLAQMKYCKNGIDLIFCCDMINMGCHMDTLTGIVMYRGTKSNIVFTQQLGRVLSSSSKIPGIVFDVVDNIHRTATYSPLRRESKYTAAAKKRLEVLDNKQEKAERYQKFKDGDQDAAESVAERHEFEQALSGETDAPAWSDLDASEKKSLDRRFSQEPGRVDQNSLIYDFDISTDLIAIGKQATYKELIAKTDGEQKSIRCREAFRRWEEEGGELYDENGKLLTRAEMLKREKFKPGWHEHLPMGPYCQLKKVSVEAVLNQMEIA